MPLMEAGTQIGPKGQIIKSPQLGWEFEEKPVRMEVLGIGGNFGTNWPRGLGNCQFQCLTKPKFNNGPRKKRRVKKSQERENRRGKRG